MLNADPIDPYPRGLEARVGITPEQVIEAVRQALAGHARATSFHPKGASGTFLWNDGIAGLRRVSCRPGSPWVAKNDGNFPTIERTDMNVRITLAPASHRTGLDGLPHPVTNPRGEMTRLAIEANVQGHFDFATGEEIFRDASSGPETWWLLVHVDVDEVRFEVSLPSNLDHLERICNWTMRFRFPPMPLDGIVDVRDGDDDGPGLVDIPLPRR